MRCCCYFLVVYVAAHFLFHHHFGKLLVKWVEMKENFLCALGFICVCALCCAIRWFNSMTVLAATIESAHNAYNGHEKMKHKFGLSLQKKTCFFAFVCCANKHRTHSIFLFCFLSLSLSTFAIVGIETIRNEKERKKSLDFKRF